MNTSEILTKAAEVITERGWHIGDYQHPNGCAVCVIGAISIAVGLPADADAHGGDSPQLRAVRRTTRHLERWLGVSYLTEWNDRMALSPGEVTTALRECAADLTNDARACTC